MIPFQKIFTLVIRTFSRPMLNYIQQSQKEGKMAAFRWFFIAFGRRHHHFEHWLNHKILKTTHKKQISELKDEILLQKGISAFYEWIFYSIVIGLPLYQLYQGAISAQKKQQKLQKNVKEMQKQLKSLNTNLNKTLELVKERNDQWVRLENEKKKQLNELEKNRQIKRNTIYRQYLKEKQQQERKRVQQMMKEEVEQQPISLSPEVSPRSLQGDSFSGQSESSNASESDNKVSRD